MIFESENSQLKLKWVKIILLWSWKKEILWRRPQFYIRIFFILFFFFYFIGERLSSGESISYCLSYTICWHRPSYDDSPNEYVFPSMSTLGNPLKPHLAFSLPLSQYTWDIVNVETSTEFAKICIPNKFWQLGKLIFFKAWLGYKYFFFEFFWRYNFFQSLRFFFEDPALLPLVIKERDI